MDKVNNHRHSDCPCELIREDGPVLGKPSVALLFDPDNDWLFDEIQKADRLEPMNARYTISTHFDPRSVRGHDIVFVLGYTKILKPTFLASNKLTLVIHESDLPRGKGFSPVQWQILEGRNEISICLIQATQDLDAGDILEKGSIQLGGHELFDDIRRKQAAATLELMERFLRRYPQISATPQTGAETVFRRRCRQDDRLDIHRSIDDQFNALRIVDNEKYPAYFERNGHTYYLKIYRDPQ